MPESAILVRTHQFGADVQAFVEGLASDLHERVFVVFDTTRHVFDVPSDVQCVKLTTDFIDSNLLFKPDDVGWRCGDYFLYAACHALPEYDSFWMVEPDVRMNGGSFAEFFTFYDTQTEADLLTSYLLPAVPKWYWHPRMSPFGTPVMRSFYPLIRTSRRAIQFMQEKRVEMSEVYRTDPGVVDPRAALGRLAASRWYPNDEAFTATVLYNSDFACRDLNEFGRTAYSEQSFRYTPPLSGREYQARPPDGLLYHPVLSGEAYFRKMETLLRRKTKNNVIGRDALNAALKSVSDECGPGKAAQLSESLAKINSQTGPKQRNAIERNRRSAG